MKTYFGSQKTDSSYPLQAVVAIGNFDGVHLGHREILNEARAHARQMKLPVAVFTFNPHPTVELRPETPLKLLMTYEEKRHQLELFGVEYCVEEPFDADFASTSAHDFFFEILLRRLHTKVLVLGEDFAFGRKREGTIVMLQKWCDENDVALVRVSPFKIEGQPVSSSKIREFLHDSKLADAEAMLGHPFFYRGEIVHGDKRGRTIGFPTANMNCAEKFPLPLGVYATSVIWRGREYASVTNIGRRPTFTDQQNVNLIPVKIETHILDQTLDLYGEVLEVRFYKRLREEKKFDGIDSLKAQIQNDVILARQVLSSRNF